MSLGYVGCGWLWCCSVVVAHGCPWYVVGWPRKSGRRAETPLGLGSHADVQVMHGGIGYLSRGCSAVVVVVHQGVALEHRSRRVLHIVPLLIPPAWR